MRSRPRASKNSKRFQLHSIHPAEVKLVMSVNGHPCEAVLDTGAAVSVIASSLSTPSVLRPTIHQLSAVGGHPIATAGIARLPVKFGTFACDHEFFVCPDLGVGKCILGADFFAQHQFCLNFASKTLSNPRMSTPFQCGHTNSTIAAVSSSQFQHHIRCPPDTRPIHCRPYRVPMHLQEEVRGQVQDMLDNGVITPSTSSWSSPVLLTPKKNGTYRFCVDYRRLNAVTSPDPFPMPVIEDLLNTLSGQQIYSTLDLKNGYWQIPLAENDREKTAFTLQGMGHFQFQVMPFGLSTAPATFQRAMETTLKGLPGCCVYLDDIIVFGASTEEHDRHLRGVQQRLDDVGFVLNKAKCHFGEKEVAYLGHTINAGGVRPNGDKVQSILSITPPKNLQDLQSFLGMANYYRRFIDHYSTIAQPLYDLTQRNVTFTWDNAQQEAFDELRQALATCPVLQFPNPSWEFVVATDASNVGLGATLSQLDPAGDEKVIAYLSRSLTSAEKNLATIEKECLAIVWALSKWRHYLLGRHFTIFCDHKPLQWLHTMKTDNAKLSRWAMKLGEYTFTIKHIDGCRNHAPDALSRLPPRELPVQAVAFDSEITPQQLAVLQSKDPELAPVIYRKKHDICATTDDVQLRGISRRYIQLWNQLVLLDDALYRCLPSGKKFLVLPRILRPSVITTWHEQGHVGVAATLSQLKARFYWPGMEADVQECVGGCLQCQRRKQWHQRPEPEQRPIPALRPMELWAMDFVGPLQITGKGNRYILTMCDQFTRWPEAVALPDQSANSVASAIMSKIVCTHGVPEKIVTDQGRNFESQLISHLTQLLGINKVRTTAYHPQGNGMCEKLNGTLVNILSSLVNSDGDDWDACLDLALWHYRTKMHSATGVTPYETVFGRTARQIPDFVLPSAHSIPPLLGTASYVESLKQRLHQLHTHINAQAVQKQLSDGSCPKDPQPLLQGEEVLLEKGSRKHKFDSRFDGPFKVVTQVDGQNVVIQRQGATYRTHRRRIKRLPSRLGQDMIIGRDYEELFSRMGGRMFVPRRKGKELM